MTPQHEDPAAVQPPFCSVIFATGAVLLPQANLAPLLPRPDPASAAAARGARPQPRKPGRGRPTGRSWRA